MNVREIFLHHALGVTPKALKTVVSNTHIQTTGENFMKKSLIAAALLGTFAASAFAASARPIPKKALVCSMYGLSEAPPTKRFWDHAPMSVGLRKP